MKNLGIYQVKENGATLVVELPDEWLASKNVKLGDPLYSRLILAGENDYEIRVHLEPVDYAKKAKVRPIKGVTCLNVKPKFAEKLGLEKGTAVTIKADLQHDILIIRRAP